MEILDPGEKIELLAINRLRRFVEKEERMYVKMLKDWKTIFSKDPRLANPHMLAASLAGYLRLYDLNLKNLMWDIWPNDDLRINRFYNIIGKYFVDREAAT